MLGFLLLDLIIVFGFMFMGLVVILKSSQVRLNQLFLAFVTAISAWVLFNYFSNDFSISYKAALLFNHLTLFMPGLVLLLLLYFSLEMCGSRVRSKAWIGISLVGLAIYGLSLTPAVFSAIHRQGSAYAISFTNLGDIYFLTLLINIIIVLTVLIRGRKRTQGEQRERVSALLKGVSALLIINIATNALLPILGGLFILTNIGPLSAIFVIYALWYSIVKHRLFDIRLVIARSLAYVLSLATLGGLFLIGTFALSSLVLHQVDAELETLRWFYAVMAIGLALLFNPLKKIFDRVTNKVFFRDAYDSQQFLNSFNELLVTSYSLQSLQQKSVTTISQTLKTSFCVLGVREYESVPMRFAQSGATPPFSDADTVYVETMAANLGERLIVVDEIPVSHKKLRDTLQKYNVAILIRLAAGRNASITLGYLTLGAKKSGNTYSQQDKQILQIISNQMVIAIQNALRFEEIENFNITLQQKVNDATKQMRRNNEKLRSLDETKDDFISMASHQLRTPLTSVKGYISMVLEGDAGKLTDLEKQMLTQAFISSQRMVYLIADLLNVSRIKTGKFMIETAPVNLARVVSEEIGQLVETAKSKDLTLSYTPPTEFPDLLLDETKTRQVIMNFIDNAIYYTPAGGNIEVKLLNKPQTIELKVIDNGMGVPKAEQPHLFTKFYRAGNARKARPDGTGLGLFMAKKVVVAQGGSLLFDSHEGKGSTFGFTFSKSKLAPVIPGSNQ